MENSERCLGLSFSNKAFETAIKRQEKKNAVALSTWINN